MNKIQKATEDLLLRCGCSPALVGFEPIRIAIELAVEEPHRLRRVCRDLYPIVAKRMGSDCAATQQYMYKAVRNLMDNADTERMSDVLIIMPKLSKGTYTLKEFISTGAMLVRREVESS